MRRAFTLIELLLYSGIVAVLLSVLSGVLLTAFDTQLESAGSSAVDHTGRYLLARLAYDIHRASAITTPAAAGTSATSLGLTIGGGGYTYAVADSQLQLLSPLGTDTLTSWDTRISDLAFTRLANPGGLPSLQISFTLESTETTANQTPQVRSYQTSFNLR